MLNPDRKRKSSTAKYPYHLTKRLQLPNVPQWYSITIIIATPINPCRSPEIERASL